MAETNTKPSSDKTKKTDKTGSKSTPRSTDPPPNVDKTPHAPHGDVKSVGTESPAGSAGSTAKPSSHSPSTCSPDQHSDSPNTETVLAALQRASTAAAERRRVLDEQKKKKTATPVSVDTRHHILTTPQRSGHHSAFSLSSSARRPRRATPQTTPRRSLSSYCRELISELNGLDRMFRYGKLDFTPIHTRRLISQEVQRIENYLSHDESNRFLRPLREALSTVPVLETIGQPPLRIPPAMMQLRDSSALLEHGEEGDDDFLLDDGRISVSTAVEPVDVDGFSSTDESDDESHSDCSTEHQHEKEEAILNEPELVPDAVLEPEQITPPITSHSSPHQNRSTPRSSRKVKLPPILEAPEPTPLQVVYTNGVPDDVGFTRRGSNRMPMSVMSAKIYIPQVEGYNFIGRILGPRGISVRRLETETTCKILIRGRGSVKDPRREEHLRTKEGWSHLRDHLHVLITAFDDSPVRCRDRLDYSVRSVQRLLTPQYDEYKRQQLMQLAIINGTYRP